MKKMAVNNFKKGQVSIFIILGIAIIIVLIILYAGREDIFSVFFGKSNIQQVNGCVRDSLEKGLELVSRQGGSINPENYYLYKDDKIKYICYTEESFKSCIMQIPLLKENIEKELEEYMKLDIKSCLQFVKNSLERKGSIVSFSDPLVNVKLVPDDILVDVELNLKISDGDESENYKNIKLDRSSKMYDFVVAASEIANDEVNYGDTETTGYMYLDKDLKIEKIKQGDDTTVYILSDRNSKDKFNFAVKSIPIPPGWIELDKFE